MNKPAAERDNDRLHSEAVQSEIFALLSHSGPLHCGAVARHLGISPYTAREHLHAMVDRGEIDYNWIRGYSV
jgi:predicted ArsR family transcriptional regulator